MSDGETTVAIGVEKGRAVMRFPSPVSFVAFDPSNASSVAEALARAAYEAHNGRPPPDGGSDLARQVKARYTEELRDRMITRVAVMLASLRENKTITNGKLAMELVDRMFSDAL
jgi:hypothetical protein